ncbi:MAG: carotenoid oxygenase, partial [Actinobacteria bacterium]|nr:carotenoid oxygenase [Actinomycetota bacterium]
VHDCAITENHLVVFDMSVTFNMDAAAAGATFPYRWNNDHPSRVGLVPLGGDGSQVRWFDVDPGYVFHPINAHEDGGRVVLDVVRYERIFDRFPLGPADSTPAWWRWTLDHATGAVMQRQIDDRGIEFPRVDERLVGRNATVGYATGITVRDGSVSIGTHSVVLDLARERLHCFELGEDLVAGEWVMVPSAASHDETDGYLMAFGFNRSSERGELIILDAAAPDAGFLARVLLPGRLPIGFHGNWFAR